MHRRRFYILATAASVAVGSFAFISSVGADDQYKDTAKRAGEQVDRAAERTRDTARQGMEGTVAAPDAEGIRDVLAAVTEAGLTKGGFDDLVERFVDADRNRLGQSDVVEAEQPTLDGRIAQLQKDWQAKYGKEFDINDESAVFNEAFAMIRQSEIGEGARLAGERTPGVPPADAPRDPAVPPRDPAAPRPDSDKIAGGDTNREPGRNIATVTIPASHGLPALNVPMIHEFPDAWKIDAPDGLTAEQLRDNLLKHLTMIGEQKDQWPADVNEAYRVVSHHVLAAVLNADKEGGMTGQDPLRPRSDTPATPAPR